MAPRYFFTPLCLVLAGLPSRHGQDQRRNEISGARADGNPSVRCRHPRGVCRHVCRMVAALPDLSTPAGGASVLPDGTTIMEAPLSINSAAGRILSSNLASNPAF